MTVLLGGIGLGGAGPFFFFHKPSSALSGDIGENVERETPELLATSEFLVVVPPVVSDDLLTVLTDLSDTVSLLDSGVTLSNSCERLFILSTFFCCFVGSIGGCCGGGGACRRLVRPAEPLGLADFPARLCLTAGVGVIDGVGVILVLVVAIGVICLLGDGTGVVLGD